MKPPSPSLQILFAVVVIGLLGKCFLYVNEVDFKATKSELKANLAMLYATHATEDVVIATLGLPRTTSADETGKRLSFPRDMRLGDRWSVFVWIDKQGKVYRVHTENISLGED